MFPRPILPLLLSLVAAGCAPPPGADPSEPAPVEDSAPEACDDEARCLFEGTNSFGAGNDAREVEVRLPAEPQGAPVIFVWHYLHGTPRAMLKWMGTDALVDAGYIVLAPASRAVPGVEWQVTGKPEGNPDVELFDALAEAVASQYATDTTRVYATGFSAGGLFTSYLTMHRATALAATAPFSGGVPTSMYSSPATALPVMLTWGGESDIYGGFSFADASEEFATALVEDGHEVVTCLHTAGHWLPPEAEAHALAFFDDHGGEGDLPWSGAPEHVPAGCELRGR